MSEIDERPPQECQSLVSDRYTICSEIGKGSYGICYAGLDVSTGQKIAIKVDPKKTKSSSLLYEIKIYRQYLKRIDAHTPHIPALFWAGTDPRMGHVMVMELMGPNLDKLFEYCHRKFTLKTILMIAVQVVDIMESVHRLGLIHQDIKPENFLMGGAGSRAKRIHIIDFGLAKPFIDRRTDRHIEFQVGAGMTGTPRYCSVNANRGYEQSRRDDMEAVAYMLAYFHLGSLPWQGLRHRAGPGCRRVHKNQVILAVKDSVSVRELFEGLAPVFVDYLSASKQLAFTEKPDYSQWTDRFGQLLDELDYKYDWDAFYGSDAGADQFLTHEVLV